MKTPQIPSFKSAKTIFPAIALAAAGVVGLKLAWGHLLKRSVPPRNGRIQIAGLSHPVEIIRDQWGVPHIYAQSEDDLFFAQGFVHAQDRLFQMDTHRRVGAGRISEIVGPSGLATDRFARYFGWPRAAEAQVAGMGTEVAGVMGSYCAGVNAFISQGNIPLEFNLLAYRPEPWRYIDTASWGAVLAWGLSVNWESEMLRSLLLETLGPEKTADLTTPYGVDYQSVIPDEVVGRGLADALLRDYQQFLSNMPLSTVPTGKGVGSNNWVVDGKRTSSGRPILANDPHLPPIFPALWYENHLIGGDYNVTGFTMPGVPGVIIGHNEQISWGLTNAFPDVQDVYIERFHPDDDTLCEANGQWMTAETVHEEIKVRGRKPVRETVRYTQHGPVFSDLLSEDGRGLSLKWASHSQNDHLRTVLGMNKAANWTQFRESLRHWGFPSQNVVYADKDGNIGYQMPGLIPIRRKGAGIVPVPGWRDDYEWDGWIPFEELPISFNPDSGMIVTANNRVQGDSYPHFLSSEWLPDYRAKRIKELLDEHNPLTLADNARIQFDTVSLQARHFMRLALPLVDCCKLIHKNCDYVMQQLKKWDYDMRADLIAPSLFFGWLTFFTAAVFEQATGPELAKRLLRKRAADGFPLDPYLEVAPELAMKWLASGSPEWVGDIKPLLFPALQKTIASLEKKCGPVPEGWQWGNLHSIKLQHPIARIPCLGRSWKPLTIPVSGDGYTVNQSDVKMKFPPDPVGVIASCRMLIDVGQWDNCLAALPGGQSGYPASKHYLDGLADWENGRYHPMLFSRHQIEAAAEGRIFLEPVAKAISKGSVE